ncbi:MAG: penicillin-binding transpeptidase domain-containing protein [Candidatus Omnitrophota bacterium]|nr:penicillin-binding protein [Candidatus Omnitrophota bacterium]MBU1929531.1 penicillin-binding protein [Candidatus Omnitrophota bacterium]MBU2035818.1 penicillin-binding protein [Candidatus Omnitrophota bacterium]MBU2221386.1 penicillin-binding protein [Candidatus Omnitrophota bacterium]MBU2258714.1 penicillin-binding protein [Candidatus Omnitrophota bacterium]
MYIANYNRKTEAVFILCIFFLIFCIARLLYIQFFRSEYLASVARKQHNLFIELEPRRGVIYDANLKPQAVNISVDSVYATPRDIKEKDKQLIIEKLAPVLNADQASLKEKMSKDKSFIWLARKITTEQSEAIRKLNLKGIGFIKESKRCYPNTYLASQVIGFAGLDNAGLEGLELTYDKYLKGEPGWAFILRDARQKRLDLQNNTFLPKDGYDLVLTIDEVIQYIAERELDKAFNAYHAKAGSIVVMNPFTGEILAMANRPTFDLNEYISVNNDQRRNRSVCDLFEPGSVFKIVTASSAIEEKRVNEEDKFFCENGAYRVANHILHDHQKHGILTFREVIEQSSNIGTTKIAQMLGADIIYHYVRLFGFGSKLGIDMPGEISGMIKEPRFWSKTSIGAVPIGHEVGVTALQLASAVSVIANGGQLMKPYIVSEIKDKYGQNISKFTSRVLRRVISADTALRVKKILAGVVVRGTGKLAKMANFTAAGKTGTAQKLEPNGSYSHGKFIASFIGFAPVENPVIAIAVVLDEPRPAYFGGVVSAPVFKNVSEDVLRYYKAAQTFKQTTDLDDTKPTD